MLAAILKLSISTSASVLIPGLSIAVLELFAAIFGLSAAIFGLSAAVLRLFTAMSGLSAPASISILMPQLFTPVPPSALASVFVFVFGSFSLIPPSIPTPLPELFFLSMSLYAFISGSSPLLFLILSLPKTLIPNPVAKR